MSEALEAARELLQRAAHIYVLEVPLPVLAGGGLVAAVTLLAALKWIR